MKPLIAVDLGSRNLHIAEGTYQKGVLKISNAGSFQLPEGTVRGDRIQNTGAIAELLSDSLKNMGVKAKTAVITINGTSALVKDIQIPIEKKAKKIEAMITNELHLNYNVKDYFVIQFKEIEKEDDEDAMLASYRTVSIDETIVENCRDIFLGAKIRPYAMDINLNAVDKLLNEDISINGRSLKEEATMLIDFGHSETTAFIYSPDKPLFFRHISSGSEEIEKILAEETFTDIEDMRENKEGGMKLFSEDDKSQRYFQMVRAFFYSLNDELRNIIKFYNNRYKDVNVEKIYLFGEGSRLVELPMYWGGALNVSVEMLNSISSVELPGHIKDPLAFLNCFGALIRY